MKEVIKIDLKNLSKKELIKLFLKANPDLPGELKKGNNQFTVCLINIMAL